jgi:hypothetical protein
MHLIGNRVEQGHTRADDDRMDHQGELIEQPVALRARACQLGEVGVEFLPPEPPRSLRSTGDVLPPGLNVQVPLTAPVVGLIAYSVTLEAVFSLAKMMPCTPSAVGLGVVDRWETAGCAECDGGAFTVAELPQPATSAVTNPASALWANGRRLSPITCPP